MHLSFINILATIMIISGMILICLAWDVLYKAQQKKQLATTGPYAYIRHPQYLGFILFMAGFFLQWPTLLTALMFPVLVAMYIRLARKEEREVKTEFKDYEEYARKIPAFIPRLSSIISSRKRGAVTV